MEKYFTAILIVIDKESGEIRGLKYRNIRNYEPSLQKFIRFAQTKGASEINLYGKISRKFSRKIKLDTDAPK